MKERPASGAGRGLTRRASIGLAAGAVAAAGAGWLGWRQFVGGSGDDSIAVMPFKNLSGDSAQDYFAEGLTEEVRSALSRLPGLSVLGAASSAKAAEDSGNPKDIARQLNVALLLQGSTRRAGDRIRVGVEIINGSDGFTRWRKDVERKAADVFALQSEIAAMIASALSLQMATDDPIPGGTRNVGAYEAYLRGKSLFNAAKGEESDRAAKAQFEIAVAADPNFALAHAGLSRVWAGIGSQYAKAGEIKAAFAAAVEEAQRAVDLAPTLADGHLALGYARFAGQLDVKGAAASYQQAYRYGDRNADIILLYSLYTVRTRKFAESRAAIERALALDPLNARTWRAAATIALASRRYADVAGPAAKALALNPAITNANALIGQSLLLSGKLDDARKAFDAEPSPMNRLTGLAMVDFRAGKAGSAEQMLAQLIREKGDAVLYQQAQVLSQFGALDAALDRLEKAYAVGDSGLTYLVTDPFLDPVAKQPRFQALRARMGFD